MQYHQDCPLGQVFDAYRRRCLTPARPLLLSSEDNDSGANSDADSNTSSDSGAVNVPDNSEDSTSVEEVKPKVKFECTEEGTFPDPNNCARYFICTLKKKDKYKQSKLKCPKGQQFDVALQLCTDDVEVLCG